MIRWSIFSFIIFFLYSCSSLQPKGPSSFTSNNIPNGYQLVFQDEFEKSGMPNPQFWTYEEGFIRNLELQYYRPQNASVKKGKLIIEGKRHQITNESFNPASSNWKESREWAQYSSASITTEGRKKFQYGIFEFRAKLDPSMGLWPAIWMLGTERPWPENGEIDILEFFRIDGHPTLVTSTFWLGKDDKQIGKDSRTLLSHFTEQDPDWIKNFHVWKMDWTPNYIRLYLDDELLNEVDLTKTYQPDGFNPFHHPHYILINLAIGAGGGDPTETKFPRKLEVDFVRVYQKENL